MMKTEFSGGELTGRKSDAPVCQPAFLRRAAQLPKRELALCPFPDGSRTQLLAALKGAPHYAALGVDKLLDSASDGLRVILLAEQDYYARQAAVYLAAISHQKRQKADKARKEADDFWDRATRSLTVKSQRTGNRLLLLG